MVKIPQIIEVKSEDEINHVSRLAEKIWREYYTKIIGISQVEYMLNRFQSSFAIKSQISNAHEYSLIKLQNKYGGYAGLIIDVDNNKMMINKIYILSSMRGEGLGFALLSHIVQKCTLEGISTLYLTVNKHNSLAISWYQRHGFKIIDSVKKDIGGSFFMDDYIMERYL